MADSFISFSDGALLLATLLGPLLAVQAQKMIERATEKRNSRLNVFSTLMTTRATRLSNEYVRALNSIDLAFGPGFLGIQRKKYQIVIDSWKDLLDALSQDMRDATESQITIWNQRCNEKSNELLYTMSNALGFNFDKIYLSRAVYHPQLHVENEKNQNRIQSALISLLEGQTDLPMKLTSFPMDNEAASLSKRLHEKILEEINRGNISISIKKSDN